MKNIVKIALLIIGVVLFYKVTQLSLNAHLTRSIVNTAEAAVRPYASPHGVEDITIDSTTGTAYLAAHHRWADAPQGHILMLDTRSPAATWKRMVMDTTLAVFKPHGIFFLKNAPQKPLLFVVSHDNTGGGVVEVFQVQADTLKHRQTFRSEAIISPNDVLGISPTEFYVTNDHTQLPGLLRTLGDYWMQPSGNVVHYKDGRYQVAASSIAYANGINRFGQTNKVHVASTTLNKIRTYQIEPGGRLTHLNDFDAQTGVDNIEYDGQGNLWVGCHPQLLKFVKHSKDSTQYSPSEVIRLEPRGNTFAQTSVWLNDGSQLSACSVAAPFRRAGRTQVLVGGVFQPRFLLIQPSSVK